MEKAFWASRILQPALSLTSFKISRLRRSFPHPAESKGCARRRFCLPSVHQDRMEVFLPGQAPLVQRLHKGIRIELLDIVDSGLFQVPVISIMAPIMAGTPVV